jgi:hypothetical protein
MSGPTVDSQLSGGPPAGPRRFRLAGLLGRRSVQLTIVAWITGTVVAAALAGGELPFHRPDLHQASLGSQFLAPQLAMLEALILIAVAFGLTRRRVAPDVGRRAPDRAIAARETAWLIGYGIAGLIGGLVLGRVPGFHPISFHLTGIVVPRPKPQQTALG